MNLLGQKHRDECQRMMAEVNSYVRSNKYEKAVKKLAAVKIACPELSAEAERRLVKIYIDINQAKENERAAKDSAIRNGLIAQSNYLVITSGNMQNKFLAVDTAYRAWKLNANDETRNNFMRKFRNCPLVFGCKVDGGFSTMRLVRVDGKIISFLKKSNYDGDRLELCKIGYDSIIQMTAVDIPKSTYMGVVENSVILDHNRKLCVEANASMIIDSNLLDHFDNDEILRNLNYYSNSHPSHAVANDRFIKLYTNNLNERSVLHIETSKDFKVTNFSADLGIVNHEILNQKIFFIRNHYYVLIECKSEMKASSKEFLIVKLDSLFNKLELNEVFIDSYFLESYDTKHFATIFQDALAVWIDEGSQSAFLAFKDGIYQFNLKPRETPNFKGFNDLKSDFKIEKISISEDLKQAFCLGLRQFQILNLYDDKFDGFGKITFICKDIDDFIIGSNQYIYLYSSYGFLYVYDLEMGSIIRKSDKLNPDELMRIRRDAKNKFLKMHFDYH